MTNLQTITFSTKWRSKFDFPRFKLKDGEKVRIALPEPLPKMAVTHYIKDYGQIACLGSYEKVMSEQMDPDCPFCKISSPGEDPAVRMASRRFFLNVIQYVTNRGLQPISPTTIQVFAWFFGEDKFSSLVGVADMHADPNKSDEENAKILRAFDLQVHCENETWQRFNIQAYAQSRAAYLADQDTTTRLLSQYNEEKLRDPKPLMGKVLTLESASELTRRIAGATNMAVPPLSPDELAADRGLLDSLTSGEEDLGAELERTTLPPLDEVDFDALLGDNPEPQEEPEATPTPEPEAAPTPEPEAAPTPEPESQAEVDLDELLNEPT